MSQMFQEILKAYQMSSGVEKVFLVAVLCIILLWVATVIGAVIHAFIATCREVFSD